VKQQEGEQQRVWEGLQGGRLRREAPLQRMPVDRAVRTIQALLRRGILKLRLIERRAGKVIFNFYMRQRANRRLQAQIFTLVQVRVRCARSLTLTRASRVHVQEGIAKRKQEAYENELESAAYALQAAYRGKLARRANEKSAYGNQLQASAMALQNAWRDKQMRRRIDAMMGARGAGAAVSAFGG
jgi:hypothetical protein